MSNKTNEVITKAGQVKVVMNKTLTFREYQDILDVYRDETLNKAQTVRAADKVAIEKLVVSINGKSDNVFEDFMSLDMEDALEISKAIEAIVSPKKAQEI